MNEFVSRGSGSQFVYDELRRQILSLELAPGTRLYEPALASALNVSRTPLREALGRLVSESLLERQNTGGVAVPVLDAKTISELYDVRAALESLMAGAATAMATAQDVRALRMIVDKNAALVDFPDEAMKYGQALHAAIGEIAGISLALKFHSQVASQMERYRRYTNNSELRRSQALAEHRGIVDVIAAGDAAAAGKHAFDHVISARDEALRAIGTSPLAK